MVQRQRLVFQALKEFSNEKRANSRNEWPFGGKGARGGRLTFSELTNESLELIDVDLFRLRIYLTADTNLPTTGTTTQPVAISDVVFSPSFL